MQEVLEGLKPGVASDAFRDRCLRPPIVSDPIPLELFPSAAKIYRQGQARVDDPVVNLIAAIATVNSTPVWHRDRDFAAIARYTGLEAHMIRLM